MPFWVTRGRFPRTYKNNQGSSPQKRKITNFLKVKLPTSKKSTSSLYWSFELLPEPHTQIGRKTHSVFSTIQNNGCSRQNTHHPLCKERIQGSKRSSRPLLPTGTASTAIWLTIGPHGRCKFSCSWLCSVNRRRSKPEIHFSTQNLRSYSLWFKDIYSTTNQKLQLRKKIFCHLSGFQRIRT